MKALRRVIFMMIFVMLVACTCAFNAEAATPRDDSAYIQNLIDTATPGQGGVKTVTIPSVNPNDPYGGSVYQISNAIEIPSNTTVKIDNCTIRLNDGVLCNIFISKGCYNSSMSASQELTDISIIGIGNAVLDGGVHNGITEKTATAPNGFSTVRYNTSVFFRNVNGFKVSGITVKEPRYWGMTYIYCRNGEISDITFDCSNDAPNQDGIDLRLGCNNIDIFNISGAAGDDVVALTTLNIASDTWFNVQGKNNDISDVSISDVKATSLGGHGIVRLLCHHGNKVYNIDIKNIEDIGTNHVQGVLRIGDINYAGSGTPMQYGDIHSITVDGVISNGRMAIYAPNPNVTTDHVTYKNVTQKYVGGGLTNLKDANLIAVPMSALNGCTIYRFEGGSETGWTYNNNDMRVAGGTFNGKSDAYTMWPVGADRPGNGIPLELTTAISKDTTLFDSYRLQLVMAHMSGTDPDPNLLKIYYSTDNGQTWSSDPIPLTAKFHGNIWSISSSTKCDVWTFTSIDIAELTDKRITNLMVRPYGEDGSIILGAFRMISLSVIGDHPTTHFEPVAATCVNSGTVEYWKCNVCNRKYNTASCTAVIYNVTAPIDKVNGHSITEVEGQSATETEDGWEQHYKCTLCENLYADAQGSRQVTEQDITIPATGNDQGGGNEQPDNTPPAGDTPSGDTPDSDGENEGGFSVTPILIICGVAALCAAVAVITVITVLKRKK